MLGLVLRTPRGLMYLVPMTTWLGASFSRKGNGGTKRSVTCYVTEEGRSQAGNLGLWTPRPVLLRVPSRAPPTNGPAPGLQSRPRARTLPPGAVTGGAPRQPGFASGWPPCPLWENPHTRLSYPGVLLAQDWSVVLRYLLYLPRATHVDLGFSSQVSPSWPCSRGSLRNLLSSDKGTGLHVSSEGIT